jgi:hypothetical protein
LSSKNPEGGLKMKKTIVSTVFVVVLALSLFGHDAADDVNDHKAIGKMLNFMGDSMNRHDGEVFRKYFHRDFKSLSVQNNELKTETVSQYLENAEKMKLKESRGRTVKVVVKSRGIKIMGHIGFAQFEVYIGNDLQTSVFMLLVKFEEEWKFMRGISVDHGEEGNADPKEEKEAIMRVIGNALIDGSGNYWDVEKFKKGFHPVFTGLSYNRKKLENDSFSDWERIIKKMKTREPEGHQELITGKFPSVAVLGNIGFAEVKLYVSTRLKETVYLLLLKFKDGWKIVNKLDIRHFQKKIDQASNEKKVVVKVIREAYLDGIQNLGNIETIRNGFHPDFALLYIRDNRLNKLLIKDWIESVKKRKQKNPDGPKVKTTIKFLNVDVVGTAATAKFELYRDSKLIFTDIMSLLKFDEGWRIVSKISHRH